MAVNLSPVGGVAAQFFTNTGAVLTGGKIYTYAAGTTTPATTYTSSNGATPWTNPIVLDAAGRVSGSGEIWLTDGISYKLVLKDSTDVLIATYDNITGINSNAISFTNSQEIQTATSGQTVFTLTTMQYQVGTNSLSVFVDGVNQYGPGAQYAYTETSSTSVTFINGLHVGAVVKFTSTQQQGAGAVDASQVSYTPPFTGSVTTNVEAKLSQYISVIDFGADPTGATDSTTAIQAAITAAGTFGTVSNYGAAVYFPSGKYKISSTINLLGSVFVSLFGEGRSSVVSWAGSSSSIMFSMDNGSDASQVFVEKLHFVDPVNNHGVTAFSFCKTAGNAVVNVTFRQNMFENLNRGIDMNQETDQMLIDDNYFLTYYDGAIKVQGYCANIFVKNNHFRDGKNNSYAVVFGSGNSLVIDTNTVQTSVNGAKGFYIASSTKFTVTNTYFEVSAGGLAGDGPFLTMYGSTDGYVADNYTTGAVGDSVMVVDTNCRVITFGNHRHTISGGTPSKILQVDGTPVGISVIGTFDTNNVQITPFSGNVDYFLGYTNSSNNTSFITPQIYASKPINQYRDQKNIASSTTADLINFGTQSGAWQIYAFNTTELYWSISFVRSNGTTAAITNTYQSNANLVLSVTGNKLQAANGITSTRTIQFSASRIF
jgi:Pectate lyase superfamily protein